MVGTVLQTGAVLDVFHNICVQFIMVFVDGIYIQILLMIPFRYTLNLGFRTKWERVFERGKTVVKRYYREVVKDATSI